MSKFRGAWRAAKKTRKDRRRRIRTWVANEVMPHERKVRAWLSRARLTRDDIDDVIQDSYCRIAMLDTVDHISRGDAYFFSTARNLLSRRLKRAKVVPFEAFAEAGIEEYADEAPSPEREAAALHDLMRLREYVAQLPDRCRHILELRKFEDLSQKEIARRMGVSENIVENDLVKGMRLIQEAWRDDFEEAEERFSGSRPREASR